ncbi:mitochondrial calcium uniporter regulator 1 [Ailuropoda melanoleuca]|uniref:mitochondrial calcium uniporter regulator 1 n=1 Tax=Ailuropoda melanoleuca TaxID=9646 RepID=UPI001494CBC6|nr:mitochondrial calcium uniporter regulator 1 [Ailuropoda melanoleuca]
MQCIFDRGLGPPFKDSGVCMTLQIAQIEQVGGPGPWGPALRRTCTCPHPVTRPSLPAAAGVFPRAVGGLRVPGGMCSADYEAVGHAQQCGDLGRLGPRSACSTRSAGIPPGWPPLRDGPPPARPSTRLCQSPGSSPPPRPCHLPGQLSPQPPSGILLGPRPGALEGAIGNPCARQMGQTGSRLGSFVPAAGRGGAGRYLPGLSAGVAWAAGALHLCRGRVAALTSSRRELSLSAGSLQLEHRRDLEHKRRDFTSYGNRKLYFDTHALVCLLEENGFTTQQAEITVSALVKITDANMDIVYKDMVTKMQQEITVQQIMSQIANVKKDMIILEKSEFSALRAENEKINVELHRLKQQVMDEVVKVRTDTKLDFNLEKSRVKELYSLNERKLLEMRTEMVALHAQQDRAVTQTDRKIDTEVAGLKTMLESHKLDNIKYLAGSVFTCLTVALGFYRLWI